MTTPTRREYTETRSTNGRRRAIRLQTARRRQTKQQQINRRRRTR